jgi:hypothetical protein
MSIGANLNLGSAIDIYDYQRLTAVPNGAQNPLQVLKTRFAKRIPRPKVVVFLRP